MTKPRCAHCGVCFTPAPQVPNQTYCSEIGCQKERRRQWQKSKLQSDPDYRDNQSRAQKAWTDRNPDYWRKRRQNRPDYRNYLHDDQGSAASDRGNKPVEMGSLNPPKIMRKELHDGVFRLTVLAVPDGVKMNSWIVELSSIHEDSSPISHRVKR